MQQIMYRSGPALVMFAAVEMLFGQNGPTLAGGGYFRVSTLLIAPGQIVTLHVDGLQTVLPYQNTQLRSQQAATVPLPKSIAGISVMLVQQTITGDISFDVPLLSILQKNMCPNSSSPACFTSFLTVQIPYELQIKNGSSPYAPSELVISENGTAGQSFSPQPDYDAVHVLSTCDANPIVACRPIVTHADGSLISADSPAGPGEVVVIYAWGLGRTTPQAKTGDVSQTPAPIIPANANYRTWFAFEPNAPPANAYISVTPPVLVVPLFAGLTSGQVGLYQINTQIPAVVPSVPSCDHNRVRSNLTINIAGVSSFDGAAICVQRRQ